MKSLEYVFTTLSLLLVTIVASFIYYRRIKEAQEEYEQSKDVIRSISAGFARQVARIARSIQGFEEIASEAHHVASEALQVSQKALDTMKRDDDTLKELSNKFETTDKAITDMREEIKELSKRPVVIPRAATVDAAIPLEQRAVLGQLTPTEFEVLTILDDMEEGTGPEIRERIQKTREHTARLLKKLYEMGFIDRNTSGMPYRYNVRKEIVDLVKDHRANNISL